MATRARIQHSTSFAASAHERAIAWQQSEALGALTPEAEACAEIMAGYSMNIMQKAGGSSRARMEQIARQAFDHAEVMLDRQQAASAPLGTLAIHK